MQKIKKRYYCIIILRDIRFDCHNYTCHNFILYYTPSRIYIFTILILILYEFLHFVKKVFIVEIFCNILIFYALLFIIRINCNTTILMKFGHKHLKKKFSRSVYKNIILNSVRYNIFHFLYIIISSTVHLLKSESLYKYRVKYKINSKRIYIIYTKGILNINMHQMQY